MTCIMRSADIRRGQTGDIKGMGRWHQGRRAGDIMGDSQLTIEGTDR